MGVARQGEPVYAVSRSIPHPCMRVNLSTILSRSIPPVRACASIYLSTSLSRSIPHQCMCTNSRVEGVPYVVHLLVPPACLPASRGRRTKEDETTVAVSNPARGGKCPSTASTTHSSLWLIFLLHQRPWGEASPIIYTVCLAHERCPAAMLPRSRWL